MALLLALLALLSGAGADAVAADAGSGIEWNFGGFGTIGAVHSSESQADYTANVLNPGSAGYSHNWSAAVDSRIGAQLGATLGSQWSAVLQVVAERNLQDSYMPAIEWANIKYQVSPELSIRLGRIALPMYLAGDYRKVGYALQTIRPPVELYGALPISSSDGIDASYREEIGPVANVTQLFFGHTDIKIGGGAHAKASGMLGLSDTVNYGAWTIRASAMTARLTVDLGQQLFDAFRAFGPTGESIADTYGLQNKRVAVGNIGVSYDPGEWFVMSEFSRLNARSFLGDKTAFYATGGYRFGAWTPYVGYAKVKSNEATHSDGVDATRLPPQLAPVAGYLDQQLNGLLSNIAVQHSVSAGLRWDVSKDWDVKVQYDRLLPQGGSSGTLINVQPGFQSGHPIQVLSLALDFVF